VRIRLIGIDTPEVDWYGGRAQCFGAEAGLYTRRRLDGHRVRLAFDVDRFDRYGRTLAYVYVGRELLNITLVRLGYARADPVPPDTRMATLFANAESTARSSDLGLWAKCSAIFKQERSANSNQLSESLRPITMRWIWLVPSTICSALASRMYRSTGYSCM
jgi:endonuclease YncB( thermonuclease family)